MRDPADPSWQPSSGGSLRPHERFQQLVIELSADLAAASVDAVGPAINKALASIGEFTGADRAYLFQLRDDGALVDNTHEWCAAGIEPQIAQLQGIVLDADLPWFASQIRSGAVVHVADVDALPAGARLERGHFVAQAIQSLIVVPLQSAGGVAGFLGFDAVRRRRVWTEQEQGLLRFVAGALMRIINYARAERARRASELDLQERERRLTYILEGTHVGTWEWNVQSGATTFNERWAEIAGYTLAELEPVSIETWRKLAHPDDLERSGELLAAHFAGELPFYDAECRMRHKAGHWVWVHDRGRVFSWTDEGRPLMMYGTHTDITGPKALEEQLRCRADELRAALADVKTLSGLIPICSYCKRVRDDRNYWREVEEYVAAHTDAAFSHGLCPDCFAKHFPHYQDK